MFCKNGHENLVAIVRIAGTKGITRLGEIANRLIKESSKLFSNKQWQQI